MISARILLASVITGVVARLVWELLNGILGTSFPGQLASVGVAVMLAGGVYAWMVSHMRIPEWQQIESMFLTRLRAR